MSSCTYTKSPRRRHDQFEIITCFEKYCCEPKIVSPEVQNKNKRNCVEKYRFVQKIVSRKHSKLLSAFKCVDDRLHLFAGLWHRSSTAKKHIKNKTHLNINRRLLYVLGIMIVSKATSKAYCCLARPEYLLNTVWSFIGTYHYLSRALEVDQVDGGTNLIQSTSSFQKVQMSRE